MHSFYAVRVLALVAGLFASSVAFSQSHRCAREDGDGKCMIYSLSLIELLANPILYDGKTVLVNGYLNLEFEGNALYVHKEDSINSLHKNGFWLDVPGNWLSSTKCKNKSYVMLMGKFRAKDTGHMGLWSGAISVSEGCTPLWKKA